MPRGDPLLILVPTALERARLEDAGGFPPGAAIVDLCGFGPIAAAATASERIARLRPARVVLVGIAGTYDAERLPVGRASEFDAVAIDGLGAGAGPDVVPPARLGFPQLPQRAADGGARAPAPADRYDLDAARAAGRLLLTTCGASASPREAALRRERFPEALAEDMEGFGVALACALHGTPLTIVRGASNAVGDRDATRWRIPAALAAARALVLERCA